MSLHRPTHGLPGQDWTLPQVEAAVSSYRKMLLLELQGKAFNKKQLNRELQEVIGRSAGSIEQKHHNISSVLRDMGIPYVFGYKPKGNRQKLLEKVVQEVIADDKMVTSEVKRCVQRLDFDCANHNYDLQSIWVKAPDSERSLRANERKSSSTAQLIVKRNYLEIEARNQALGLAGEKFILELERQRLWQAGQKRLAERIEHVSQTRGDGLGYDILSFEEDGRERLVEVKTTQFGPLTPFFATKNEIATSEAESIRYQVYRLFSFSRQPKVFALRGAMGQSCKLEPRIYSATPR